MPRFSLSTCALLAALLEDKDEATEETTDDDEATDATLDDVEETATDELIAAIDETPADDALDDAIDDSELADELDNATALDDETVDDVARELDCPEPSPDDPPQPANTRLATSTPGRTIGLAAMQ